MLCNSLLHLLFLILATAVFSQKVFGITFAPMVDGSRRLDFGGELVNNISAVLILLLVIFVSSKTYKHIEMRFRLERR